MAMDVLQTPLSHPRSKISGSATADTYTFMLCSTHYIYLTHTPGYTIVHNSTTCIPGVLWPKNFKVGTSVQGDFSRGGFANYTQFKKPHPLFAN